MTIILIIVANIIYSFVRYALSPDYMPGTVSDTGDKTTDTTKSQPRAL